MKLIYFQLGSLYIPPPMSLDDKQYLLSQQSPPWMSSSKPGTREVAPEWVNRDEVDSFIQQARMMQSPPTVGQKERVIPISFEKTPIKTPITPGFGPTPFYGTTQQQFNNVVSPKIGELKTKKLKFTFFIFYKELFVDPNANQFVNQGYNNIEFPQQPTAKAFTQAQKPQQQQQQQTAGTRIIPIQVERSPQPNEQTVVLQR